MSAFSPVTDADLARARKDPQFRQQLLAQSLDALLMGMQRMRGTDRVASAGAGAKRMRESVELAVRLAEILQNAGGRTRSR
jgi:hypothetical protein